MIPEPYVFDSVTAPADADAWTRLIKTLGCYLYQCAEGRVPREPLYRALEAWERELAFWVVRRLPQYEAAPWA